MAGFANVRSLVDRYDAGATVFTSWRKQPAVVTAAGYWFDMSMSPGNPKPQYYASAPLVAATLAQSTDGGIFHGAAVSPSTMHLHVLMAMTVTAAAPTMMTSAPVMTAHHAFHHSQFDILPEYGYSTTLASLLFPRCRALFSDSDRWTALGMDEMLTKRRWATVLADRAGHR